MAKRGCMQTFTPREAYQSGLWREMRKVGSTIPPPLLMKVSENSKTLKRKLKK